MAVGFLSMTESNKGPFLISGNCSSSRSRRSSSRLDSIPLKRGNCMHHAMHACILLAWGNICLSVMMISSITLFGTHTHTYASSFILYQLAVCARALAYCNLLHGVRVQSGSSWWIKKKSGPFPLLFLQTKLALSSSHPLWQNKKSGGSDERATGNRTYASQRRIGRQ